MSEGTRISWATDTFNTHWGCVEVKGSEACTRCYARTFAHRLGLDLWGHGARRRFFGDRHWKEPLRWNRKSEKTGVRRRVFVNSMSDTFEGRRDLDAVRARLWDLVPRCPNLDFLFLTKRPQNILRMTPPRWRREWPPNVWVGTTAEDQRWADVRVPFLGEVPAPVRFVSAEPLLAPLDLTEHLDVVNWVLVGGESGHGARRMEFAWALDLLRQCRENGVAFHFKQKGAALARERGCKSSHGTDPAEWPSALRIQEIPA